MVNQKNALAGAVLVDSPIRIVIKIQIKSTLIYLSVDK